MGNDLDLDWQVYYDAAKKCHDLATDLRTADKPVHDAVKGECAGMAGDAPGCDQWGKKYDQAAQQTMQTCAHLADALTNFGYVLYATGYNYGLMNRSNPPPLRPDVREVSQYTVSIPTSVGANGDGTRHDGGVQAFYNKLVGEIEKAFGKLPNGNVNKLAKAENTWKTFAGHETITGASGRITAIIGLFDNIEDRKNLPPLLERLTTLRDGADQVAAASLNLAGPVAEYHAGTVDARAQFKSAIDTAMIAIGVSLAVGAALAAVSFGGSLAASGGAIATAVAETINAIRAVYQSHKFFRTIGIVATAAGITVAATNAFEKVPDLHITITSLVGIIAMRVLIDDDGPEKKPDTSTTPGKFPDGFTLPPEVVADRIAEHAGHRSVPGVDDDDLPEYIEKTIENPGYRLRDTPNGTPRMGWWDEETGTVIIREGNNGTFFQPDEGYEYFKKLLAE
ncbi:hypothetical protein [Nocardia beijingensis]|uniref:hypothetical protein n=1 Tax=Nocardia beijingensis TaxID=95162 RepID=UPI000829CF34|nr:hypothetical protein [Nocardia beijingensis]